jgi:putative FmdB family regulatory protein
MPLREYICLDCGHQLENFERSAEDALSACPQCESARVERLISSYGGYQGNFSSASTKPRNAGAFAGRKKQ